MKPMIRLIAVFGLCLMPATAQAENFFDVRYFVDPALDYPVATLECQNGMPKGTMMKNYTKGNFQRILQTHITPPPPPSPTAIKGYEDSQFFEVAFDTEGNILMMNGKQNALALRHKLETGEIKLERDHSKITTSALKEFTKKLCQARVS